MQAEGLGLSEISMLQVRVLPGCTLHFVAQLEEQPTPNPIVVTPSASSSFLTGRSIVAYLFA